jgi:hypothetical protein
MYCFLSDSLKSVLPGEVLMGKLFPWEATIRKTIPCFHLVMNVSLESQELDTTKIKSAEFILLISFTRKSYFPRFVRCQMITLLYSTLHLDPLENIGTI